MGQIENKYNFSYIAMPGVRRVMSVVRKAEVAVFPV